MNNQVLASYSPTYCFNCGRTTGFDGWGMSIGGRVDFYCEECGKKKDSTAFAQIYDRALRQEIVEVITMNEQED